MSATPAKEQRAMPKGGRKGGTSFPRSTLEDAFGHARKLVSKTHVTTLPRDAVFAGVVGAKSGAGNMRISALKQYGYLEGRAEGYRGSPFAKQCVAAPEGELLTLHQQAALRPAVFKDMYNTFKGDAVAQAKLRQRASELGVHPTETKKCVEIYVSSLKTAGLVELDGDKVLHLVPHGGASEPRNGHPTIDAAEADEGAADADGEGGTEEEIQSDASDEKVGIGAGTKQSGAFGPGARAVFNVNVTLDSSLDIEKLQKQLELLKRFGAI